MTNSKLDIFPASVFMAVVGVDRPRYNQWVHRGHLTAYFKTKGSGRRLGWSLYDLAVALMFKDFVDAGILATVASDLAYDCINEEFKTSKSKAIFGPLHFYCQFDFTDPDRREYYANKKPPEGPYSMTMTVKVHDYLYTVIDRLRELGHLQD